MTKFEVAWIPKKLTSDYALHCEALASVAGGRIWHSSILRRHIRIGNCV
jgi:hypothetical protein